MLIAAEWDALRLRALSKAEIGRDALDALRLSAEYRRQQLLLGRDLSATMKRQPVSPFGDIAGSPIS
jgi:hypothetical protein